jgi:hypothetical protein
MRSGGLISASRDIVDLLVRALIERDTLSGVEIGQIISRGIAA